MSTKRYLVICEETCPDCDGEGRIVDSLWHTLYQDIPIPKCGSEADWDAWNALATEWFLERGRLMADGSFPPEEYQCDTCNGTGTWRREVDLAEALQPLQASVSSAANTASCLANGITPD